MRINKTRMGVEPSSKRKLRKIIKGIEREMSQSDSSDNFLSLVKEHELDEMVYSHPSRRERKLLTSRWQQILPRIADPFEGIGKKYFLESELKEPEEFSADLLHNYFSFLNQHFDIKLNEAGFSFYSNVGPVVYPSNLKYLNGGWFCSHGLKYDTLSTPLFSSILPNENYKVEIHIKGAFDNPQQIQELKSMVDDTRVKFRKIDQVWENLPIPYTNQDLKNIMNLCLMERIPVEQNGTANWLFRSKKPHGDYTKLHWPGPSIIVSKSFEGDMNPEAEEKIEALYQSILDFTLRHRITEDSKIEFMGRNASPIGTCSDLEGSLGFDMRSNMMRSNSGEHDFYAPLLRVRAYQPIIDNSKKTSEKGGRRVIVLRNYSKTMSTPKPI